MVYSASALYATVSVQVNNKSLTSLKDSGHLVPLDNTQPKNKKELLHSSFRVLSLWTDLPQPAICIIKTVTATSYIPKRNSK